MQTLFDILFPPSDEQMTVRNTNKDDVPLLLKKSEKNGVTILTHFGDATVAALVHEAKFHNNRRAVELLGALLETYLQTSTAPYDFAIPIPLSRARERARGYNQVLEIMKTADVETQKDALKRVRDTAAQTELSRKERLENVRDAFELVDARAVKAKRVLLIDDVATTGATLNEARTTLLQGGPQHVACIALAG